MPGFVVYRFDAAPLFFNADDFKQRIRAIVAAAAVKPAWFLYSAEAANVLDFTDRGGPRRDSRRAGRSSEPVRQWPGPRRPAQLTAATNVVIITTCLDRSQSASVS